MGLFGWIFRTRKKARATDGVGSPGDATSSPRVAASSSSAVAGYRGPAETGANQALVSWHEGSFPLDVVGEANYQDALIEICGGYNRHGQSFEILAEIKREKNNPYDTNAIAVSIKTRKVGYLSKEQARRISSQMQDDGIERASCKAKIVGGWRTNQYDSGHFGVRLGIPTRGWIDFGLGRQASTPEYKPKRSKPKQPEAAAIGPLVGEYVFVWGAPRNGDVAQELAGLGATIMAGVGKSTTIVVHVDDRLTTGAMASATYKRVKAQIDLGSNLELVSLRKLRERLRVE